MSAFAKATQSGGRHDEPDHVAITGASSGIGAALVRAYCAPGRRLSIIARNQARLEEVADDGRTRGAEVDIYLADVTDSAAIRRALGTCDQQQPVRLLIANAGIGGRASLASKGIEPLEVAQGIFLTNAIGVINTVSALAPNFVARGRGQIAIMSSLAGLLGIPACPAYSASKAAVRTYGAALRASLAPSGVKVSVVCPGFVETPMSATLPFRPPLMWTADRAARYIVRALASGRGEVLFPWPLALAVRALGFLPAGVAGRLLMTARIAE